MKPAKSNTPFSP